MARDPRYDVLFEPVRIGPVTARNRFYQVPHCSGMGHALPNTLAHMRAVKAEGGWAVVNTEYCSIHSSSDDSPYPHARLWDEHDVSANARMAELVHAHGALAGCELWYGGSATANLFSRQAPFAPSSLPASGFEPVQTRRMDGADIRAFRRWHREAALRAMRAGFDIVYVYATHGYLLNQFLSPALNDRGDAYGGSLENRVRLVREIIEETRDAVGERCAVAVRFSADAGSPGDGEVKHAEQKEIFSLLAELPDLWDINIEDYTLEAGASRFVKEAAQEDYVAFAKQMTSKPVVGVGRFTSPDTMVRQITQGRLDFIGAARPSIADPFLPKKIEEGRLEDIRECIGCNVCIASDTRGVPLRCTQNPTMGEEWRRGWHPERIAPRGSDASVLVVGAGPAGLEAARALGQRGYRGTLAEAGAELGGRVSVESRLPGLAEWARVRDYRAGQIAQLANVDVYRESRLSAGEIADYGFDHVAIATGARWRRDGVGRWRSAPLKEPDEARVFTPDDIMHGAVLEGPVVVFDDDHYYMGSVVAEKLARDGVPTTLLTPAAQIARWCNYTLEYDRLVTRLLALGVRVETGTGIGGYRSGRLVLRCVHGGAEREMEAGALVLVTARLPDDALYTALQSLRAGDGPCAPGSIRSIARIGDCEAPGTIAAAVHAGHRYARELDTPEPGDVAFRRERPMLESATAEAHTLAVEPWD